MRSSPDRAVRIPSCTRVYRFKIDYLIYSSFTDKTLRHFSTGHPQHFEYLAVIALLANSKIRPSVSVSIFPLLSLLLSLLRSNFSYPITAFWQSSVCRGHGTGANSRPSLRDRRRLRRIRSRLVAFAGRLTWLDINDFQNSLLQLRKMFTENDDKVKNRELTRRFLESLLFSLIHIKNWSSAILNICILNDHFVFFSYWSK